MTRKTRGVLIALGVLAGLIAVEVGLRITKGPEACVQVENLGPEPIEGLVVSSGADRAESPPIGPGNRVRLFLGGRGPQTLQLSFRQRGNGMTGYQMPGFDPALMTKDGSMLVIQIKPGTVIRFQDEAEPSTPVGRSLTDFWRRFWAALEAGI